MALTEIETAVKLAARISHETLDGEVTRLVEWAKAELVRVGVPDTLTENVTDPLIKQAIITGALTQLLPTAQERAEQKEAFNYQLDSLRKHKWEVNDDGT